MTIRKFRGTVPLVDEQGDGGHIPLVAASNVNTKFRDAFEVYHPNEGGIWIESKASGDIVTVDGNAAAASYLDLSLDPLSAGTETYIESVANYEMPIELAIGAHMSQRTLGQEFSVEIVDTDQELEPVPDLAISTLNQATTTLTIVTTAPHGLTPGKSIGIRGFADSRANYPSLVVASIPNATTFTATAGPGGTIPSLTLTSLTGGFVYFRERLGRANEGVSMIFENATATNASVYIRSESGDALPSGTIIGNHSTTIGSTASVQAINAANTYAFQPTTEYKLRIMADKLQLSDVGVDSTGTETSRVNRTQVIPSPDATYKLRIRATNNKALTVPVAHIQAVAKTGTTTATVTTQTPHGLTTGDVIAAYGVRDQTNFANLTTATAVASVIDANNFTVVWGSAVTASSQSGIIYRVNGGNLPSALGAVAQVVQSVARTNNILTLIGNATWTGMVIGDYINLVALHDTSGVDLLLDGAYRVRNISTTTLEVEPITGFAPTGIDITTTNCGGAVIRRTCLRISFIRVFDFERARFEATPRPSGDQSGAFPVNIQNTVTTTLASTTVAGTVATDAAIGNPVTVGHRASNANIAAMSAAGDNVPSIATMIGVQVTKPYAIPESEWAFTGALTTTSDVAVQTAAGAGLKRHVTWVQATNTGASAVDVLLRDGTTTRLQFTIPASQSVTFALPTGIPLTANTALNVQLSAVGTVRFNALGYTAP